MLLSPSIVVTVAVFLSLIYALRIGHRPVASSLGEAILGAVILCYPVSWPFREIVRSFKLSSMKEHIRQVAKWVSENGIDIPEEFPQGAALHGASAPQPALLSAQTNPVSGTVFCTECGTVLAVSDIFCDSCGNRMVVPEAMQQKV